MKRLVCLLLIISVAPFLAFAIDYSIGPSYLPLDLITEDGETSFNVHPLPGMEFAMGIPIGPSIITQLSLEMDEIPFFTDESTRESIMAAAALLGVGYKGKLGERSSFYALGEAGWAPTSFMPDDLYHEYFYELGATIGIEFALASLVRESQAFKVKATQDYGLFVECSYRHAFAGYTVSYFEVVHPYSMDRMKVSAGLIMRTKIEKL